MNRHKSRELALQAIYQWQCTLDNVEIIENQFTEKAGAVNADLAYFTLLLHGVIENKTDIDKHFTVFLDRPIDNLNPVELAVLRLAVYELAYCLDVPYRVVINEALELAKTFGSVDGFKYVNGVLDKAAKQLREMEARR